MHEYVTSYITPEYTECIDCNKRTPHICLKRRYCYSCHPLIERLEKEEQAKKLIKYPNNDIQQLCQQRVTPVTFVTYTITKPRTTNKPTKSR